MSFGFWCVATVMGSVQWDALGNLSEAICGELFWRMLACSGAARGTLSCRYGDGVHCPAGYNCANTYWEKLLKLN